MLQSKSQNYQSFIVGYLLSFYIVTNATCINASFNVSYKNTSSFTFSGVKVDRFGVANIRKKSLSCIFARIGREYTQYGDLNCTCITGKGFNTFKRDSNL